MAHYTYVSIDTIFSKLVRDVTDNFNERDVIEWCGEALEQTGAVKSYEEAVAFIEVKNYQAQIPKGLHGIVQIARDNFWTGAKSTDLCPAVVKEELCPENPFHKASVSRCLPCSDDDLTKPDYVMLDCNGMPLNDYDVAYYRPYFDLIGEYYGWMNSDRYKTKYTPVRASQNSFSSGLIFEEDERDNIYRSSTDEYTLIKATGTLRFSFKEGSIAIAYLRQVTDKVTGYPMIPDNVSYKEAIIRYVKMKLLDRACYSGREGACGKAQKAEQDWHWYCKQAGNSDMIPFGEDENQNLLNQRTRLIPQSNRYYGFFGNLSQPEVKRF